MKYQYWKVFYVIQPPLRKTMQVIIELIQHVGKNLLARRKKFDIKKLEGAKRVK